MAFRVYEIPIYFFNRKNSEGMETLFGNGSNSGLKSKEKLASLDNLLASVICS
jgi:hypothetical protein